VSICEHLDDSPKRFVMDKMRTLVSENGHKGRDMLKIRIVSREYEEFVYVLNK
jgi:hypothetical protein